MRLDKFLKVTRVIKRRSVANELCDLGKISVNGDVKKALYSVKEGDIIELQYYSKNFRVKVLKMIPETLKKDDIFEYITLEEIR